MVVRRTSGSRFRLSATRLSCQAERAFLLNDAGAVA